MKATLLFLSALLCLLTTSRMCIGSSDCPEGLAAERFLLHFQPDHPKGVPGADMPDPTPLISPLQVGPITLVDPFVRGLSQMVLHNFSIQAHLFKGAASLSFPLVELFGVYELPGLWWTTTGNFSVTLLDVDVNTNLEIAVLADSCFYVQNFETTITKSNFSYNTDGLLDDSGLFDIFFDGIVEMVVNVTKPTILDIVNKNIRTILRTFLPLDNTTSRLLHSDPTTTNTIGYTSLNGHDNGNHLHDREITLNNQNNLDVSSAGTSHGSAGILLAPLPVIPSREEQKEALIRFVRYQIPWMIGDPLLLPNITLNILAIAELHNMSVHNLQQVTQVQHLSLVFDGESFIIRTRMLHQNIFNRHRVLWFPGAIFRTWQWTEARLGLIKHDATLVLNRRLHTPPTLIEFLMRPVIFNPDHESAGVRTMDRLARRLLDGIRTKFGDSIKAFLYSPIVSKVNRVLRAVDARSLIKNFVCYAAGAL